MNSNQRIVFPGPVPPVSGVPAVPPPPGALGNTGEVYGIQSRHDWTAPQTDPRVVCDVVKAPALWRFSAFGRVYITILYGTRATRQMLRVQAPVVMTIPGQFTATAQPIDDAGATCEVTLTQATAGARAHARAFVSAGGGAVSLDNGAVQYVALTASTLTIAGVAGIAVPVLGTVPLVAGSVLTAGSGFQEFEA